MDYLETLALESGVKYSMHLTLSSVLALCPRLAVYLATIGECKNL